MPPAFSAFSAMGEKRRQNHRDSGWPALRVTLCTPLRLTSMAVRTVSRLCTSSTDCPFCRTMSVWYCLRC